MRSISPIDGQIARHRPHRHRGRIRNGDAPRAQEAFAEMARYPRARNAAKSSASSATPCATPSAISAGSSRSRSGKILAEGEGEVQEMIDICDFAVGLSRQLYGLTIASERPQPSHDGAVASARRRRRHHRLQFPRRRLGLEQRAGRGLRRRHHLEALRADAAHRHCHDQDRRTRLPRDGVDPAIFSLVIGDGATVGKRSSEDRRIPLISATGSAQMGRRSAKTVARRLGRTLLELGGNNALIVAPSADLDLATRAIVFGAVGTAGQRCTTTRRIIVHESVADKVAPKLLAAYKTGAHRQSARRHADGPADR